MAEKKYDPAVFSRTGGIAKVKDQSPMRWIHNLRRSGVNQKVTAHEQVILPRIADFIEEVLTVAES